MMDTFTIITLCVLLALLGLAGWWAVSAFKRQRWISFTIAFGLMLVLGFGWNYFPLLVWMILAPIFGWSFT